MPPINQKNLLTVAFAILGFSAMISQIVLIRELMIFFTGNELVVGLILAIWLLWTAVGSGVLGRVASRSQNAIGLFVASWLSLGLFLPLSFVFIRLSKVLFSISAGETFSPFFIFLIPMISLAPIGCLIGLLYTLSCKLLGQLVQNQKKVPGTVYFWEGLGAGIAGFIASIFLFRFFENYQVVIFLMMVNVATAILLSVFFSLPSRIKIYAPAIFLIAAIVGFRQIQLPLQQFIWGRLTLLESKTTIYGNITVTALEESVSFFENGVLVFTYPDELTAEETVHFALLEHPNPQRVLVLGGETASNLQQILAHPTVEQVDFLLLDPEMIRLTLKYIPEAQTLIKNQKIHVHYSDGRIFLAQTQNRYDLILVNLGAPQTTRVNRFFTREFYQLASQKLTADGLLSFSIPITDNVIGEEQAELFSCLFHTLRQVFPEVVLLPGYSLHFLGSKTKNSLTTNIDSLAARIHNRNLPTRFVRDYYLRYRLTPDRLKYAEDRIASRRLNKINTDFRPVGYFYNIYLWLSSYNRRFISSIQSFYRWFGFLLVGILLLAVVILFLLKLIQHKKPHQNKIPLTLTIMCVGCTAISLEVLLIHGFQAIYGYAYYQLALILSGFMIGLTFGSWHAISSQDAADSISKRFFKFQWGLIFYPLVIYFVLSVLAKIVLPEILIQLIFLLLIFGLGFLCGHQFPAASEMLAQKNLKIERTGGSLYAWDLVGSIGGALLISSLLIPIFGVGYSCLFFSLLNIVAVIFLRIK